MLEDEPSLASRADRGTPVDVQVESDGAYSTDVHLAVDLPGGRSITVEVDTGSDAALILDEKFAVDAGASARPEHSQSRGPGRDGLLVLGVDSGLAQEAGGAQCFSAVTTRPTSVSGTDSSRTPRSV